MTAFNISKQWCINAAKQEELLNELTREETIADVKRLRASGNALISVLHEFNEDLEYSAESVDNFEEALAATDRPEYKDG